ncbi:DUF357 domain-containing protein [archaeon]|jgi:uncharacterized protein|nr:DUF357 domain-containing protein [archaeon]MBT6698246.1 DUF357 domain-containing protein [archaeon]
MESENTNDLSSQKSFSKESPNNLVTTKKLLAYFKISKEALDMARDAFDPDRIETAKDFFNMAQCYYSDAKHFYNEKHDMVLAFAALNYAHGWLDAGARIGIFQVKDDRLFTVDSD